jgi:hypothetical protein
VREGKKDGLRKLGNKKKIEEETDLGSDKRGKFTIRKLDFISKGITEGRIWRRNKNEKNRKQEKQERGNYEGKKERREATKKNGIYREK